MPCVMGTFVLCISNSNDDVDRYYSIRLSILSSCNILCHYDCGAISCSVRCMESCGEYNVFACTRILRNHCRLAGVGWELLHCCRYVTMTMNKRPI